MQLGIKNGWSESYLSKQNNTEEQQVLKVRIKYKQEICSRKNPNNNSELKKNTEELSSNIYH